MRFNHKDQDPEVMDAIDRGWVEMNRKTDADLKAEKNQKDLEEFYRLKFWSTELYRDE